MIPSPWVGVILALATFRLTRLAGWDEFPLAAKVRAWVIGEGWVPVDHTVDISLPGKQPSSEVTDVRPAYSRPMLAHLVHCPFCIGWWISLSVYGAWLLWPHGSLYAFAPLALSGAVGLIAKNLDA